MLKRLEQAGLPGGAQPPPRSSASSAVNLVRSPDDPAEWAEHILFDLREENGKLRTELNAVLRESVSLGGAQVGAEVDMPAGWQFNMDNASVRAHLERQLVQVRNINEATRESVRRALVQGVQEGDSLTRIMERVAGVMDQRAGSQSYRIANTEIHEAISAGRYEGFRQTGVQAQAWLTSGRGVEPDGPVRKSHHGAEQHTLKSPVPVGGLFELRDPETGAVSRCHFPGEGTLPAGERINCSCVVVARLTDRSGRLTAETAEERGEDAAGDPPGLPRHSVGEPRGLPPRFIDDASTVERLEADWRYRDGKLTAEDAEVRGDDRKG